VLTADNAIKSNSLEFIAQRQIGDEINLRESEFVLLFNAFFAEIETKFM
jgi:hypothetical protein